MDNFPIPLPTVENAKTLHERDLSLTFLAHPGIVGGNGEKLSMNQFAKPVLSLVLVALIIIKGHSAMGG
ncbi:MAG: hypothetical protein AVDCRST_MAG93-3076 [uncultured Chloroflexia bacterium]|uniref:Uncharacterized protein n=1 Tax=uncultured Chloroflexia bacterium TaxID=1672391 RepID=A0A6J4JFL9_9CHLR|nr:MAG: hypothetical protein AVDCRST_MAG93-3076 [uncultured Chloroflexia bacterium]